MDPRRSAAEKKFLLYPNLAPRAPGTTGLNAPASSQPIGDAGKGRHDDLLADYANLLALGCGMLSLMMKNRLFAWQGLFFSLVSLANTRSAELDMKQLFSSLCISIMGLILAWRSGY